jgi:hypothetical protein
MKITTQQLANLLALFERGGCAITSEWVNGDGRYTTRKAIPPFCERIERTALTEGHPERIRRMFRKRKCRAVIAITRMRAAKKVLEKAGLIERNSKDEM